MPIKIPDHLPAKEILNDENIFVMDESVAYHQDIRPLRIAILKPDADKGNNGNPAAAFDRQYTAASGGRAAASEDAYVEEHILRAFGDASIKRLMKSQTNITRYDYYRCPSGTNGVRRSELLGRAEGNYGLEQTTRHLNPHICWAAQAGLYHHYGVPKYRS